MSSYYAVKSGKIPGIYRTWNECQIQVKGFSGAKYKKFKDLDDAERFISNSESKETNIHTDIQMWTDGSAHLNKSAGYSFVYIDKDDNIIYQCYGKLIKPPYTSPRAEIVAIVEGLKYYDSENYTSSLSIHTDCKYVVDAINSGTNLDGYKAHLDLLCPLLEWFNLHKNVIIKHVPGHAGLKYNELCDKLAKLGSS